MNLGSDSSSRNSQALAMLRIGVGIFFLIFGQYKVFGTAFTLHGVGIALVLGFLVRSASFCGLIFMLTMLFSSDYPGAGAAFWQYFGASLSHSVFALCFAAFLMGRADSVWSVKALRKSHASASGNENQ